MKYRHCLSCHERVTGAFAVEKSVTLCAKCLEVKAQMEAPMRTERGVELDLLLHEAMKAGELRQLCKKKRLTWAAFFKQHAKLKSMKLSFLWGERADSCESTK